MLTSGLTTVRAEPVEALFRRGMPFDKLGANGGFDALRLARRPLGQLK